jgi:stress response protein SCP2
MARLLKNEQIKTGSSAIQVPVGDTSTRPAVPVNGQIRYNTDLNRFEIYYNSWQQIAINGTVTITKDTFTGDGITTVFTLSKTPATTQSILVFVGNVHQNPDDAFTIATNQITFYNPPPSGQTVIVFHNFASTDAN